MEAEVARWRDEKGLEKISFRQRINLSCDVQRSPRDGNRSAKAKQSIEMERCDLGVVTLKVGEVEVVGQRLLAAREPHGLEKSLAPVLKLYNQLQLGSPLLLADPHDGQGLHGRDGLLYGLPTGGVHLLLGHKCLYTITNIGHKYLGHPKLELLPHILSGKLSAVCQSKLCQAVKDKYDNCGWVLRQASLSS